MNPKFVLSTIAKWFWPKMIFCSLLNLSQVWIVYKCLILKNTRVATATIWDWKWYLRCKNTDMSPAQRDWKVEIYSKIQKVFNTKLLTNIFVSLTSFLTGLHTINVPQINDTSRMREILIFTDVDLDSSQLHICNRYLFLALIIVWLPTPTNCKRQACN